MEKNTLQKNYLLLGSTNCRHNKWPIYAKGLVIFIGHELYVLLCLYVHNLF